VGFPKDGNHAREALVALAAAAFLALAGAILVVGGAGELRDRWNHFSFYSRGVLVPIFAAYLAWQVRHQIRGLRLRWSRPGVLLTLAGFVTLGVGVVGRSMTVVGLALPVLVGGIVVLVLSTDQARQLAFPIGFLALMTPLPPAVLPSLSLALQTAAATVTARTLSLLGIVVHREGVLVHLQSVTVEINETCNGLQFLMAMLTIGAAVAWVSQRRPGHRAAVVAAAAAFGLAGNWVRIIGTALIAEGWEPSAAQGAPHAVYGEAVYVAMVAIFIATVRLMQRRVPRARNYLGEPAKAASDGTRGPGGVAEPPGSRSHRAAAASSAGR